MKKRITINVDEVNRNVVSIWENPNNKDLNIHIAGGGGTFNANSLKELVAGTEEENYLPSDKHISIHNSPQSPENSMLKRTVKYANGKQDTSVQITGAIKTDNLYTPALFRICGDLCRDRYLLPELCGDEIISLGAYTPSRDQLRFMVVVSDKDKPFTPDNEHPSNDIMLAFSNFSVTIIWSYFNQPSHPHAIDFFLSTTRESGPVTGFDWWQIYNLYTDLYMACANEYFEVYGKNV
ncbi:MAG: hypothetical protein JRC93_08505 [Deltaproteobacteria bacterium]|nr:hypothetical protein [Deltaproteobacteria bacterium]